MYLHDTVLSEIIQLQKRLILHDSTYMNELPKLVKFIESKCGRVVIRN